MNDFFFIGGFNHGKLIRHFQFWLYKIFFMASAGPHRNGNRFPGSSE